MQKKTIGLVLAFGGSAVSPALGQFIEPQVLVHQEFSATGIFGWAVSEMSDLDGDGAMEAIVGAPYSGGVNYNLGDGLCRVYSGATGELLMDLGPGGADENFGWSMADAGDVDGDGFADVAVGATRRGGFAGSVYLFSGGPADRGTLIRRVDSLNGNELFGYAVAGLGDVDGDGFGEVVVGAALSDLTDPADFRSNDGRAYVVSGADGSAIHTVDGWGPGATFGAGVAGIGDLDGDDIGDFAVGSPGAERVDVFSGATGAHLLGPLAPDVPAGAFGQFFVGRAGDVDADGTPDVYVGDFAAAANAGHAWVFSGADGSVLLSIAGNGHGTGLGFGCGRGAGDIDGDGHADLVVGSYIGNMATAISGRTGGVIRTMTSTLPGASFGYDAVGLGDVTGDGLGDFLIGAGDADRAYIIAGIEPCPADLDEPFGVLDLADVQAFVDAFLDAGMAADLAMPYGLLDLADVQAFVAGFVGGCP